MEKDLISVRIVNEKNKTSHAESFIGTYTSICSGRFYFIFILNEQTDVLLGFISSILTNAYFRIFCTNTT